MDYKKNDKDTEGSDKINSDATSDEGILKLGMSDIIDPEAPNYSVQEYEYSGPIEKTPKEFKSKIRALKGESPFTVLFSELTMYDYPPSMQYKDMYLLKEKKAKLAAEGNTQHDPLELYPAGAKYLDQFDFALKTLTSVKEAIAQHPLPHKERINDCDLRNAFLDTIKALDAEIDQIQRKRLRMKGRMQTADLLLQEYWDESCDYHAMNQDTRKQWYTSAEEEYPPPAKQHPFSHILAQTRPSMERDDKGEGKSKREPSGR